MYLSIRAEDCHRDFATRSYVMLHRTYLRSCAFRCPFRTWYPRIRVLLVWLNKCGDNKPKNVEGTYFQVFTKVVTNLHFRRLLIGLIYSMGWAIKSQLFCLLHHLDGIFIKR